MLKTVLLLDGSEAVNSTSDYLPTRLLALRPQIYQFTNNYLNSNPLAALGVIVMRDGVAHRLTACTTNLADIMQTLEIKYFLFGGSGAMSLENGLRLSLSELVDLKRIAKRARNTNNGNNNNNNNIKETRKELTSRLRIILISSSVTLIDPHDVFIVLKMVAQLHIRIDVISFCGAVHVFEEAALSTGGNLYTPMNFDHLTEILRFLAAPDKNNIRRKGLQAMIQIGFPIYVKGNNNEEEEVENNNNNKSESTLYIACPQCGLMQTSIPSTCPLCKLLLCSAPLIHTTFIAHNELCAKSEKCGKSLIINNKDNEEEKENNNNNLLIYDRCSLCQQKINKNSVDNNNSEEFWRCSSCLSKRCALCEEYVREIIGLCPTCISSA